VPREVIEAAAEAGDATAIYLLAALHPGQLSTIGDVDTKSYALFFNSDYQLNDKLKLAVGARYSKEDKEVDWTASSIDPTTGVSVIPLFELANGRVQDKRSDTDLSPTITLSYELSDTINSYVKYATGYKSGGYNVDFLTQDQLDAGLEFDKETVKTYELGFKGLVLDQRLSFSAVTFFSQYDDYQIQQLIDLGAGTTALSIRNAAEVETKGVEFEMTYMATDNLQLTASLALLDGKFTKFPGGGNKGEDLSGYSLPGVSDYSYHVSAQYYYPIPQFQADLVMRVSYNYLDDYNTSVDGESEIAMADGSMLAVGDVEGYGLLNGRVGLSANDEVWNVYFWGRNILDEDAETAVGVKGFFGTRLNQYVSPRTYGIAVDYNF
jgi:iron complex outermembrane receptor protein